MVCGHCNLSINSASDGLRYLSDSLSRNPLRSLVSAEFLCLYNGVAKLLLLFKDVTWVRIPTAPYMGLSSSG